MVTGKIIVERHTSFIMAPHHREDRVYKKNLVPLANAIDKHAKNTAIAFAKWINKVTSEFNEDWKLYDNLSFEQLFKIYQQQLK